ncbi:hypothetical protein F0L68_19320 [Solihabitans fulvus]|uniref:Uncharacterized protein n=1 Tax=Solihabitans fulvus TaxID=1892852 RepID=A0A5B2XD39_9PSEU|nr:hypothetical protein [Solihabitans fulvus]KAA2260950.1 hypothetical protein F0L68_19320 [Solihabitans fulvus]
MSRWLTSSLLDRLVGFGPAVGLGLAGILLFGSAQLPMFSTGPSEAAHGVAHSSHITQMSEPIDSVADRR